MGNVGEAAQEDDVVVEVLVERCRWLERCGEDVPETRTQTNTESREHECTRIACYSYLDLSYIELRLTDTTLYN